MDYRVILVAHNAGVRFGGEAFLPYQYFRLLRQRGIDAVLVCHERTRTELLERLPEEEDRLYFVQDHWTHKLFYKLFT